MQILWCFLLLFKYDLHRTKHSKFDLTGVQTHNLRIMNSTFHDPKTPVLTTVPSRASYFAIQERCLLSRGIWLKVCTVAFSWVLLRLEPSSALVVFQACMIDAPTHSPNMNSPVRSLATHLPMTTNCTIFTHLPLCLYSLLPAYELSCTKCCEFCGGFAPCLE